MHVDREWAVDDLTVISSPNTVPVQVKWQQRPMLPPSRGEAESGCIIAQVLIDRRSRLSVLAMQGGTEAEKLIFRNALRRSRVGSKFPPDGPLAVKAWCVAYYKVTGSTQTSAPVVIERFSPVFYYGPGLKGPARERQLRLAIHPSGAVTAVRPGEAGDPALQDAIGAAVAGWRILPPRIRGVSAYGEIDVPLLFAIGGDRSDFFMPAVPLDRKYPSRPWWMRMLKWGDSNRVQVRIGKDGRVLEAKLLEPTSSTAFNEQVVQYAKEWKFSPAVRNGEAHESTLVAYFGKTMARDPELPTEPAPKPVIPPRAIAAMNALDNAGPSSVQIRLTIGRDGKIARALIERTDDAHKAQQLVAAYESASWRPATENDAPVDYSFRLRK